MQIKFQTRASTWCRYRRVYGSRCSSNCRSWAFTFKYTYAICVTAAKYKLSVLFYKILWPYYYLVMSNSKLNEQNHWLNGGNTRKRIRARKWKVQSNLNLVIDTKGIFGFISFTIDLFVLLSVHAIDNIVLQPQFSNASIHLIPFFITPNVSLL